MNSTLLNKYTLHSTRTYLGTKNEEIHQCVLKMSEARTTGMCEFISY